ncbi:MAG: hypothetical protein WBS54_06475 [Acidobacteriota bacterium]
MFEHRREPLLSRNAFLRRVAASAAVAFGLVAFSLATGVLGYHFLEGQSWIDALVNASMLLGGMGPVGELHTTAGKLFASFYALYCGLVLIVAVGIVFAPLFHRFLHRFHLEVEDEEPQQSEE